MFVKRLVRVFNISEQTFAEKPRGGIRGKLSKGNEVRGIAEQIHGQFRKHAAKR